MHACAAGNRDGEKTEAVAGDCRQPPHVCGILNTARSRVDGAHAASKLLLPRFSLLRWTDEFEARRD